jgi:hypothetical protein
MAVAVEASRWITYRWDFKEADFRRVSTLCTLALFSTALYRFLTGWFNHSTWMILKWLPAFLLPLLLAQAYSTVGRINLSALFLRRKTQIRANQSKHRYFDLSYIYLAICIFAAGFANTRESLFYVGILVLAGWALWSYRSRKSSPAVWIALILVAAGAGYLGQNLWPPEQAIWGRWAFQDCKRWWKKKPPTGILRPVTGPTGNILKSGKSSMVNYPTGLFFARAPAA